VAKRARKSKVPSDRDQGAISVADLNRELFQAAVNLRGSIEAPDYKRYVLPIIFLRFLSLRYERRREQLEQLIADPSGEYHTENPSVAAQILGDPDEYRAAGAFIVPAKAQWAEIVKQAQADDIKVRLDDVLELLENTYPDKLRGLLPRIYAGSNMTAENLRGLINLFSKDIFRQDHGGEDLIGRVYEYFIGEFANSEGKRGGEYFTPSSIVRTLVAMLEPTQGVVFDPCCGSGGMFLQSDLFTQHNRQLSFVGQEIKDFTYRLCRMNLFIHGIDGRVDLGNSYTDDRHATLKADYILANPPFNDGAKGENGWGSDQIADKDPRLLIGGQKMPLSPRNANTMWIMHFLSHLKDTGTAGFVMASGELSNSEIARQEVRKALVEHDFIDCIVQLSGQLFANTQIPCALWFLSRNRVGNGGYRKRHGEILFIDSRKLGSLIPGSRKQKHLSSEELERMASVYRQFKHTGVPAAMPGFCKVATLEDVREYNFALTPGRYVGAADGPEDDEPFEEKLPRLVAALRVEMKQAADLDEDIETVLAELGDEK
jgi:type I restriction enzyme M protein